MKTATIILKILAAVAAVAGVVYLVATYGDKVVAWFKRILGKDECECDCCQCEGDCEACECEGDCEECECEWCCSCENAEEATEEDPVVAEEEVVAAEADFEE